MILKRVIVALVVTAGISYASAQEGSTMRLSLEEAQRYAVEHNAAMQNASLEVKKAEADKWKTLSSMLPSVKAGFDYQNMLGYEMKMGSGMMSIKIPMDPNGTFSITASVALNGAMVVGTMMKDIALEMADITRQQTEQQTRSNVRSVYVSLLVMQQTAELLDSSVANLERLAATSQSAVDVGAAEQVDADKLMVQVASLRSTVNATRRSIQALRGTLLLQLGADVESQLELSTTMDEVLDIDQAAALTGREFDITRNYNYQLLEQSEKLAKKQVSLAWMDFSPTLSAYYQYSKKVYFGEEGMNMTPPNMVGANISVPLLTTGTRVAGVKSAKLAYQESVNSRRQAEDGLRVQYAQLRYDLASALESYDIQKRSLELSQRVFNNVTEKYRYGRASSLEVTTASTDIITAQSNYIQAVMNVVNAQLSLENLLNN